MNIGRKIELENRLVNWAIWCIAFHRNEVGYPSKATIADFGLPGYFVRQSKPPFPISNILADEFNGWVNQMAIEHPEYKTALKDYYLREKEQRIKHLAEAQKISIRMFKQRLHDARIWLEGRLSGSF
jgi:hypothetical protein